MPRQKTKRWVPAPDLSDYHGTLNDLQKKVGELVKTYGGEAFVRFDAGFNNVVVYVQEKLK